MPEPITNLQLAAKLYEAYSQAVGGKAFNGDPLPTWEHFRADPNKRLQGEAWLKVADVARLELDGPAAF